MVLESAVDPLQAEKTPRDMFWVGLVYPGIGILLAYLAFGSQSSLAAVFLTTMPWIVIMYKTLQVEEEKDWNHIHKAINGQKKLNLHEMLHEEKFLIKEHGKALSLFVALFLGMIASYTLWFTILPADIGQNIFEFQTNELDRIRSNSPMGKIIGFAASENTTDFLFRIIVNNYRVWLFCIVFSFLYGAGAIFILTLNASVVGVAIGSAFKSGLIKCAHLGLGAEFFYNYLGSFSVSFCYLIHGIPEVSGYFLGALGGGIISVAVARHSMREKEFKEVVFDSLDLVILSAVVLLAAALIEVYVTSVVC